MLTDYERYQLEWMIDHGHSLKEFVQGLDLVDRDGIDSLEDAYAIWENDYGFTGEVFSNEREFKEEDLPEIMRKPEHETEMGRILKKGGALYSPAVPFTARSVESSSRVTSKRKYRLA